MTDIHQLSMVEFGNQEVHDKMNMFYEPYLNEGFYSTSYAAKYFFVHMGINHTSVDLNGYDGSLRLDCREDITSYLGKADVITNIGFSEHVGEGDVESKVIRNQYTMFKNMHDLGKAGTLYYNDFVSEYPLHGVVNYGLDFIYALPKKSNYVMLFEPFKNPKQVYDDGHELVTYVAAYRKVNDDPFMSFEEFASLPGLKNIYSQYDLFRRVHVQISASRSLSGERVPVFEIDQVLHDDKSFSEWSTFFCEEYFTSAANENNRNEFIENKLGFEYCVETTLHSIENSSIDKVIRS